MILMLTEEHDSTKKATMRELTAAASTKQPDRAASKVTAKGGPSRRKNKVQKVKEKGIRAKVKGGKRTNKVKVKVKENDAKRIGLVGTIAGTIIAIRIIPRGATDPHNRRTKMRTGPRQRTRRHVKMIRRGKSTT